MASVSTNSASLSDIHVGLKSFIGNRIDSNPTFTAMDSQFPGNHNGLESLVIFRPAADLNSDLTPNTLVIGQFAFTCQERRYGSQRVMNSALVRGRLRQTGAGFELANIQFRFPFIPPRSWTLL